MKKVTMKREFQIFKEGITDHKIVVLSSPNEPFNRAAKIQKYLYLGYRVYDMSGKEITKY